MKAILNTTILLILGFVLVQPAFAESPYYIKVSSTLDAGALLQGSSAKRFKLSFNTNEGRHSFELEEVDAGISLGGSEAGSRFFKARQLRKSIKETVNTRAAADINDGLLELNFFGRRSGRPYLLTVDLEQNNGELSGKLSHVSSFFSQDCATHDHNIAQPLSSIVEQAVSVAAIGKREMSISLDADYSFFQAQSRRRIAGRAKRKVSKTSSARHSIRSIINRVNSIYSDQLNISIKVNSLKVDNKNTRSTSSRNASNVLNNFRDYTVLNDHLKKSDIYHLFTANNLSGSVVGLAYVGSTCRSSLGNYAFGMTRQTNPSVQALVTAHEIAHNLGATHIDGANSIMSPVLSSANNTFISPSLQQIVGFVLEYGICLASSI